MPDGPSMNELISSSLRVVGRPLKRNMFVTNKHSILDYGRGCRGVLVAHTAGITSDTALLTKGS